jgi:hypothetical protein
VSTATAVTIGRHERFAPDLLPTLPERTATVAHAMTDAHTAAKVAGYVNLAYTVRGVVATLIADAWRETLGWEAWLDGEIGTEDAEYVADALLAEPSAGVAGHIDRVNAARAARVVTAARVEPRNVADDDEDLFIHWFVVVETATDAGPVETGAWGWESRADALQEAHRFGAPVTVGG